MADRRITQNTAIAYTEVNATDVLLVGQTGSDKKITFPATKQYILQNKTIGGTGVADIVVSNATQTLLNKTLTAPTITGGSMTGSTFNTCIINTPTINGSALTTITGADIQRVCTSSVTTAQLNLLSGLSQNVQTGLNSKVTRLAINEPYPISCTLSKATGAGTSIQVSAADIKTAMGLGATIAIVAGSLNIAVSMDSGAQYTYLYPTININLAAGYLDYFRISELTTASTYNINILFSIASLV